MEVALIIGGVVAVVAVGGLISLYSAKRRREKFALVAEELGLTFDPKPPQSVLVSISRFEIMQLGRSHLAINLLSGTTADVQLSLFDYYYTVGSGKNSSRKSVTIAVIQSAALRLPRFSLRPETFLDRMGLMNVFEQLSGKGQLRDINFDDRPVFSQKFVLKGKLEERIRQLFQPEVTEFLEQRPATYAEAGGELLLYSRNGRLVSASEIGAFFKEAFNAYVVFRDSCQRMPAGESVAGQQDGSDL